MKENYYALGIILIIFGCFGGFIFDVFTFGLPLLGVVLVLISNKKLWQKLVTVLILPPIVFYVILTMMFAFAKSLGQELG